MQQTQTESGIFLERLNLCLMSGSSTGRASTHPRRLKVTGSNPVQFRSQEIASVARSAVSACIGRVYSMADALFYSFTIVNLVYKYRFTSRGVTALER